MKSILKVENLNYKKILNDVSFSLEENSFNILMGKNSSGKSTLCKSIFNILEYSGSIYFDNILLADTTISSVRKNIGFVTDITFFDSGTLLSNIIFYLNNLGYSNLEARSKAYEVTRKLGISNILSKDSTTLSSSEQTLSKISIVLSSNPKLLILDIALDDLDTNHKEKLISYLKKSKITILMVTNNEEDILLCDSVLLIKNGKVEQVPNKMIIDNSKVLAKYNLKSPFVMDLSSKLRSYELLDKEELDIDKLVNKLWN